MDDLSINKQSFLSQFKLDLEVKKSKDILSGDEVKIKDLFGNPSKLGKIDKMADIFPRTDKPNDDGFLA